MSFCLKKPDSARIIELGRQQANADFSYSAVGCTQPLDAVKRPISGFVMDHNRVRLGHGQDCFEKAKAAIRQWKMFDLGWANVADTTQPIEMGSIVVVVVKTLGLWSLNPCRIVYTLDESTEELNRFGFGYGTLPAHLERGEERFSVELHHSDNSVWYDLLAYSQPNSLFAKVGYPITRYFQNRFAQCSKRAMTRAVSESDQVCAPK